MPYFYFRSEEVGTSLQEGCMVACLGQQLVTSKVVDENEGVSLVQLLEGFQLLVVKD